MPDKDLKNLPDNWFLYISVCGISMLFHDGKFHQILNSGPFCYQSCFCKLLPARRKKKKKHSKNKKFRKFTIELRVSKHSMSASVFVFSSVLSPLSLPLLLPSPPPPPFSIWITPSFSFPLLLPPFLLSSECLCNPCSYLLVGSRAGASSLPTCSGSPRGGGGREKHFTRLK